MDAVLLDTDVFSYLLKRGDQRADPYRRHVRGKAVAISFVTVGELYFGAQKKGWGAAKVTELDALALRRDRTVRLGGLPGVCCDLYAQDRIWR